MRKYYEAYEERYKTVHERGVSWFSDESSPVVSDIIEKYGITTSADMLEIGCGEGRDSRALLKKGYRLLATDISREAVEYCRGRMPMFADRYAVLDCVNGTHQNSYDFIYSVAVIHMLVLDEDRNAFYRFIGGHLREQGIALICTMGDGAEEMQSDIGRAFDLQEREHESGRIKVAGTSCRKVSLETFEREIEENGLVLLEKGITAAPPDFDRLMYAVVGRKVEK